MFELLYQGIDTLDIAFQGALSPDVLDHLKAARDEAEKDDEKQLITVGPGQVEAHILPHGMKGGYRYVLDTGPEGAQWRFKTHLRQSEWNGFVSIASGMLVTRTLADIQREIWDTLRRFGFRITGHAVNRVDYAMDFATDYFEPNPDQFVAHSNCKVTPYYGQKATDDTQPSSVTRGRRIESVTIGKMPGRQIIVYDKRRDTIVKRKDWWFEAWGIAKDDKSREIWRVEIRAGKKELKDKWNLRTTDKLQASLGDLLQRSLQDVRYVDTSQSDTNVSRQDLHSLWAAAMKVVVGTDSMGRTGLQPGAVKEIERLKAIETFKQLIVGNSIGLAVAMGYDECSLFSTLPNTIETAIRESLQNFPSRTLERFLKASNKTNFLKH